MVDYYIMYRGVSRYVLDSKEAYRNKYVMMKTAHSDNGNNHNNT